MDPLAFKIVMTLALSVFFVGTCVMMLRRHYIWLIIGQIMAMKGVTFGAFILLSRYGAKAELLSILLYTGSFFMVLFTLVGFGLLLRGSRFADDN